MQFADLSPSWQRLLRLFQSYTADDAHVRSWCGALQECLDRARRIADE